MGFHGNHTKASVKKRASHPEDHSSKHEDMNIVLHGKCSYPDKDQASSYTLVLGHVFLIHATLLLSSSDSRVDFKPVCVKFRRGQNGIV